MIIRKIIKHIFERIYKNNYCDIKNPYLSDEDWNWYSEKLKNYKESTHQDIQH